jgi:glycosyltransferase involved in cell wall biosynthesis
MKKIILWWGRFDEDYSRNRILRSQMKKLGYQIIDFKPLISYLGYLQAFISIKFIPSIIWVPCFRHRDLKSASKWATKKKIPIIFDPLISSWDKKINEQLKYKKTSKESLSLKKNESELFNKPNLLVADTVAHKRFFMKEFNIPEKKIFVINVGAEEKIFFPNKKIIASDRQILFYGSFLELHGVNVIIDAAKILKDESIKWTLIGDFQKIKLEGLPSNISFESTMNINKIVERIHKATVLLGIFSGSDKANNVIPNKVYQSLACGKTIITRYAEAYPQFFFKKNMGIFFVKPNDAKALAEEVLKVINDKKLIEKTNELARSTFNTFYSEEKIKKQVHALFKRLL